MEHCGASPVAARRISACERAWSRDADFRMAGNSPRRRRVLIARRATMKYRVLHPRSVALWLASAVLLLSAALPGTADAGNSFSVGLGFGFPLGGPAYYPPPYYYPPPAYYYPPPAYYAPPSAAS